jgi:hypothetical protein
MRWSGISAFMVRAVRQEARSVPALLLRLGVVGFLCYLLVDAVDSMRWNSAPGRNLFIDLTGFNLFFLATAGLHIMAGSIAEEKEDNTLGLLLLSGMGTLPVLLGKTVSRLLALLFLLALQIPFTLLCVTMGGMHSGQVFAAYAMLASLILLVSGVAVLSSVMMRTVRSATVLAALILFFWHILPPILGAIATDLEFIPPELAAPLQTASMWMTCTMFYERMGDISRLSGVTEIVSRAEWFNAAAGLALLGGAALYFMLTENRQSTENAPRTKFGERFSGGWSRWFRPRSRPSAGNGALYWKDAWLMIGGRVGTLVRMALLATFALWFHREITSNQGGYIDWSEAFWVMLFFIAGAIACLSMFATAARIFSVEVRDMTLADLLALPGGAAAVVRQKTLCILAKGLPFALFMIPGALFGLEEFARENSGDQAIIAMIVIFVILQALLQLELVAHLSLRLPRIAPLITLPGHWMALMMAAGISFGMLRIGSEEGMFALALFGSMITALLLVVLHVILPERLHNALK